MRAITRAAVGAAVALFAAVGGGNAQQGRYQEYLLVGSGGRDEPGRVTTYRVDRGTGRLTQIERRDVGDLASYIAANPNHPVVYVTAERGLAMHWLRVDPATGTIVGTGSLAGSGNPVHTAVDATGATLLAVNYAAGTTDAFPLDPLTGAIAGPATTYVSGVYSHSAVFHPGNGFVYAAAIGDSTIAQWAYRDGSLSPLSPPRLAAPGGPRHITVHPNGRYAYAVATPSDRVYMYRVEADGRLTSMGTVARLPADHVGDPARDTGSDIQVTPSGRFAYASNRGSSNTLVIYSVGDDGRLTMIGHESTRGSTPRIFDIDPDGELIVVGNEGSKTVAVFRADPETGALTHLQTEDVGVTPWFVGFFRFPVD